MDDRSLKLRRKRQMVGRWITRSLLPDALVPSRSRRAYASIWHGSTGCNRSQDGCFNSASKLSERTARKNPISIDSEIGRPSKQFACVGSSRGSCCAEQPSPGPHKVDPAKITCSCWTDERPTTSAHFGMAAGWNDISRHSLRIERKGNVESGDWHRWKDNNRQRA
jgi:hypothetical protein